MLDPLTASQDWELHVSSKRRVTREQYRALCEANPELRIERSAEGELTVMAPAHTRSGIQNNALSYQVFGWALKDGTGVAGDSSTGYDLPNGANRSPDASWTLKSRIAALQPQQREGYVEICPDFVVELRSSTDRLSEIRAKMQEYIACGARLGWLIDPTQRKVWVYRPGVEVEQLDEPLTVEGGDVLPGFVLDLHLIWNPQV